MGQLSGGGGGDAMTRNTTLPPNLNDFDVAELIIQVLRTGLNALGLNAVGIKQLYQPRQVGIEPGPTLYFFKVVAPRYGFPSRKDRFNTDSNSFRHTETVWRTPTYQISGYSIRTQQRFRDWGFAPTRHNFNRGNFSGTLPLLSASDIVETAADVMQTSSTRLLLLERQVGIIRITDIRENYFSDERRRYEQNPTFDFQLSYRHTLITRVDPVTSYCINSNPIQR